MPNEDDKKITAEFELTIKDEETPVTGNAVSASVYLVDGYEIQVKVPNIDESIDSSDMHNSSEQESEEPQTRNLYFQVSDYIKLPSVLEGLRTVYNGSDKSASDAYQSLKSYIEDNKGNPEAINNIISSLLGDIRTYYDRDTELKEVGQSQEEILDKILSVQNGEDISGLICTTIHEFAMKTLNDCGMEAVLIYGISNQGGHAGLLYKNTDGKYVFNNYDTSLVIESNSLKDAAAFVYKNSGGLGSRGYYSFVNGKVSYQEFALEQESAFGEKMDKSDYNFTTPTDIADISRNSSIKGRVSISTTGNLTAGADAVIVKNPDSNAEFRVSAEYKHNNETALMNNSQSFGVDAGYSKRKRNGTYFDVNTIVAHTSSSDMPTAEYSAFTPNQDAVNKMFEEIGEELGSKNLYTNEVREYLNSLRDSYLDKHPTLKGYMSLDKVSYLSSFIKTTIGNEGTFLESDKMSLKNRVQATFMGGMTFELQSSSTLPDARFIAEDELRLNNKTGNFVFNNSINAGLGADLRITSGDQKPGLSPVVKLNASTGAGYNASNFAIQAGAEAYGVVTRPSKEFGIRGGISAQYKPENSNVTFYGNARTTFETQNLTIGGFNEQTENKLTFDALIGAQVNSRTNIYAGYTKEINKLNPTKNISMFNVGLKLNF